MSGFNTRVMLLQKWAPNLLSQLKDIDDLADIILDVWDEAEAYAEQRIIKLLEGMSCGHYCRCMAGELCESYADAIALIKGENK